MTEQSAASGLPRRTLESLVTYRKTYAGPMGLVKGKYVKSYSMGYMLTARGRSLADSLKDLAIADPTYRARISKEVMKLATRDSGSAEALIETVKEDLGAFVERLREMHEVLFSL